ncbi:MAG: DUF3035 domain-containing protein [Pseudomonadota bacterium]|nr:DUF3035 domain-containing protein [Pseudomonadota bacterium]
MFTKFHTILVLSIISISLMGCGSDLAKVLGTDKMPPDEFTILTKPPLIIPPEYNLRPPAEGEVRSEPQQSSRELQAILFGNSSASKEFSTSELNVMTGSGVGESIPNIREVLDSEMRDVEDVDESVKVQILNSGSKPLN